MHEVNPVENHDMYDDFKNMRIKLFEEFGNTREIKIELDGGSAFGIMYNRRDYFENWIVQQELDNEARGFFAMFPNNKLLPIGIMTVLAVNPRNRNKAALGADIMRRFLNEASSSKNVVVIADSDDFDIEWYKTWGFLQIGESHGYPVMVLNNY